MPVLTALPADLHELIGLINSAYRGDVSRAGWTTEADLLDGDLRTDETDLLHLMQTPGGCFLKYVNDKGTIEGTVFLKQENGKIYLGMLSVSPLLQGKGIGKELMKASELYGKQLGCDAIFMRVISLRPELIAFYERKGYVMTGEKEPFPTSNQFGKPTRELEFLIMEKHL